MRSSQTVDPIFRLWHAVVSYKYIDDTEFLQEFALLLYVSHMHISHHLIDRYENKGNPSLFEIVSLYEKIADMPIPDLLNSLDAVVDQCVDT